MFPRILVAAGVPLDEWAQCGGMLMGVAVNADVIMWGAVALFAVILTGIEAWWSPFKRMGVRVFSTGQAGNTAIQYGKTEAFIKAGTSRNAKIVGNVFRGNRTHIEAPDAVNLMATGNIHEDRSPNYLNRWSGIESYTVGQAACLWCEVEPGVSYIATSTSHPIVKSIEQLIVSEAEAGRLSLESSNNLLAKIGDYSGSMISRVDLVSLAERRGEAPRFLFGDSGDR